MLSFNFDELMQSIFNFFILSLVAMMAAVTFSIMAFFTVKIISISIRFISERIFVKKYNPYIAGDVANGEGENEILANLLKNLKNRPNLPSTPSFLASEIESILHKNSESGNGPYIGSYELRNDSKEYADHLKNTADFLERLDKKIRLVKKDL